MRVAYRPLVGSEQPPCHERHHPVDPGHELGHRALPDRDRMGGAFPIQAGVSPPREVSSTSTRPARRSRPGPPTARRSVCSHVHAVLESLESRGYPPEFLS